MEFGFISVGRKGKIIKVVQYSPTGIPNVYNLGFGDKDLKRVKYLTLLFLIMETVQMVLATVAGTVIKFTEKHPLSQVIAVGVSKSRTRLYQIGISNNFEEINKTFHIYGYTHVKWELFVKGRNYDAFLVKKKK